MKSIEGIVQKVAYTYLALPVLLFFGFWLKPVYGILAGTAVLAALLRIWLQADSGHKLTAAELKKMAACICIIGIWVYFSGIGKFVFQNPDHSARNAIFNTLVNEHWPVIQEYAGMNGGGPVALIYYFAFWLPAAAVGKVFSLEAGYLVQALWAGTGIFFAFCLFCQILGNIKVRYLLMFIFFSGLDIAGTYILHTDTKIISADHLEWWAGMQYSSFSTQLFWVFNQAVPAWLITALMLVQKDRGKLVFLYSFSVLSCTFPAVGLLPILVYQAVSCGYKKEQGIKANIIKLIGEICTWENILSGGMTGIISFLFLKNNSSGQMREVGSINLTAYLLFLFFECFIYVLLIYKYCAGNGLIYICILSLGLIPFVKIGSGGDFCMRASIPALVVLYLFVMKAFDQSRQNRDYHIYVALTLVFVIGSITPVHEFIRTFQYTVAGNLNHKEAVLYNGTMPNNFYGYTDRFFFRYLISDR